MVPRIAVARTDLEVTRIGFGCARLQGGGELPRSRRLVEAALASGISHFDTAPAYGASEAVLGEVLSGIRDVTIATKVGLPRPDATRSAGPARVAYRRLVKPVLSRLPGLKSRLLAASKAISPVRQTAASSKRRRRLERDEIHRSLDESLDLLRRDHVDILLIHEPDQFELDDELLELFRGLQRGGVIRAFGLAYDRVADFGTGFGSVAQGRIPDGPIPEASPGETRIFHGVLRHAKRGPGFTDGMATGARIWRALVDHPGGAVIFSASEPHQVRSLLSQFEAAARQTAHRGP